MDDLTRLIASIDRLSGKLDALSVKLDALQAAGPVIQPTDHALAYRVREAVKIARCSNTKLYEAITKGDLRAVKRGRSTLILHDDLHAWIKSLPVFERRRGS